jgi:transcriptional regulator of acetoin/glycerol metabolism
MPPASSSPPQLRSESGPDRVPGAGSERDALEEVLRVHGGSVSRAAEALGLSRQALYRRMERLGVSLERRPRS